MQRTSEIGFIASERVGRDRRHARIAYAAALWGLIFAVPHIIWALGYARRALRFSLGTPPGPREEQLIDDPRFRAFGLWGVAGLCLLASAIALATVRPWGERLPHWMSVAGAAGVGIILALRGLVFPGILGSLGAELNIRMLTSDGTDPAWLRWNLVLWSPWFLLGSALFARTAWERQQTTADLTGKDRSRDERG